MTNVSLQEDPIRHRGPIGVIVATILLVAALGGLSYVMFPAQVGAPVQQWLHPGSRLALGEEPIVSVHKEFLRRSALYAADWNALAECVKQEGCESASTIESLKQAIKLDWPKVFDHLAVYQDWLEWNPPPNVRRDDFFAALKAKGADALRNRCFPKMGFTADYAPGTFGSGGYDYFMSNGLSYAFEGYTCT